MDVARVTWFVAQPSASPARSPSPLALAAAAALIVISAKAKVEATRALGPGLGRCGGRGLGLGHRLGLGCRVAREGGLRFGLGASLDLRLSGSLGSSVRLLAAAMRASRAAKAARPESHVLPKTRDVTRTIRRQTRQTRGMPSRPEDAALHWEAPSSNGGSAWPHRVGPSLSSKYPINSSRV